MMKEELIEIGYVIPLSFGKMADSTYSTCGRDAKDKNATFNVPIRKC